MSIVLDDDDATEFCPMCDTENAPMGMLGDKRHYNCRACGLWFTAETVATEPETFGSPDPNELPARHGVGS